MVLIRILLPVIFFALGFTEVHPIAAVHGRGVHQLLRTCCSSSFFLQTVEENHARILTMH
jgi:predicted GTPase